MNPNSRRDQAIAAVLLVQLLSIGNCSSRVFSFKMHHCLPNQLREQSDWSARFPAGNNFPREGSYEYYAELAARDRMLHSRSLLDKSSPLALADGNSTIRINNLGFLHYTTIQIGNPATKFVVALDTGSDLLWVPCNCARGAPTQPSQYSSGFEFGSYDPGRSSTSKEVDCNNPLCSRRDECFAALGRCPYSVSYISPNTSSSGFLVEDILHLTSEDEPDVAAYITFGCGLLQTGSFIEVAADGLLGLGMEKISVPSILSDKGLVSNSFSMCFGQDGAGRINFGDKGSRDQNETPLNVNPSRLSYNVTISQLRVGTALMDLNITSLFDSGTSFTYLTEPAYGSLSESFNSQIQDRRRPLDPGIPFEYCYDMGSDVTATPMPLMSLIMKGGDQFTLHDPAVVIVTRQELIYCLAVIKSPDLNVIGQNFMTGYRVVFDRERLILGWKKFNCYEKEQQRPENSSHVPESNSSDMSSGLPNAPFYHEEQVGRVWVVVGLGYLVVVLLVMVPTKGQLTVHRYLCRRMPSCWWLLSRPFYCSSGWKGWTGPGKVITFG